MSDDPTQVTTPAEPTPPPPPPPAYESPLSAARSADGDVLDDHPEILVAGAFVGGLVLAQVLRKLGPS